MASKGKISLFQAMLIFLSAAYSPTLRFVVVGSAKEAKQAAWLSPLITLAIIIPIIFMLDRIYKKHANASFAEIMEDVLGTAAGKIITVVLILHFTLLMSLAFFNYSDKLTSTVYPNVNILIFTILMLAAVAVITRNGGITVIARMNELIFMVLVTVFLLIFFFALKDIKIERLTPISHLDIIPLLKSNLPLLGVWTILPNIFFFSNNINKKENIKKVCSIAAMAAAFLTIILLVLCLGLLGASTIEKTTVPYIVSVKQISVLNTLERLEAAELGIWIIADFVLLSILLYIILSLFKALFRLSDIRPLTLIYSVIMYSLILLMGSNIFEQDAFGVSIIIPMNIFAGFVLPVLVFTVGKIRKKI